MGYTQRQLSVCVSEDDCLLRRFTIPGLYTENLQQFAVTYNDPRRGKKTKHVGGGDEHRD